MSDRSESEQKELIEHAAQQRYGLNIDDWGDDGYGYVVGKIGRWYVSNEDDERGLYDGDEGELSAQVVGASTLGNERVVFTFTPDGMELGNEAVPFEDIEPVV